MRRSLVCVVGAIVGVVDLLVARGSFFLVPVYCCCLLLILYGINTRDASRKELRLQLLGKQYQRGVLLWQSFAFRGPFETLQAENEYYDEIWLEACEWGADVRALLSKHFSGVLHSAFLDREPARRDRVAIDAYMHSKITTLGQFLRGDMR